MKNDIFKLRRQAAGRRPTEGQKGPGPEFVTPQKEIIPKTALRALQVALIVELYINQEGPIRKDLLERGIVDLQPALEKIASFYNACRLNLVAIGLEARKADEIISLDSYLKASEKPPVKAAAGGNGKSGNET